MVAKALTKKKKTIEEAVRFGLGHKTRVEVIMVLNDGIYTAGELSKITPRPPSSSQSCGPRSASAGGQPMTAIGLAAMLEDPTYFAGSLAYHLGELEGAGIVEVVERRDVRGGDEVFFCLAENPHRFCTASRMEAGPLMSLELSAQQRNLFSILPTVV